MHAKLFGSLVSTSIAGRSDARGRGRVGTVLSIFNTFITEM